MRVVSFYFFFLPACFLTAQRLIWTWMKGGACWGRRTHCWLITERMTKNKIRGQKRNTAHVFFPHVITCRYTELLRDKMMLYYTKTARHCCIMRGRGGKKTRQSRRRLRKGHRQWEVSKRSFRKWTASPRWDVKDEDKHVVPAFFQIY